MFQSLIESLNEQGASVRAYEACARKARARIVDEPENAAALFLISVAAQRFVDAYDDQPLTVDAANEELGAFKSYVDVLEKAFSNGSADEKVAALNRVAAQLGTPKA
ncbi:hypothetical protein [Nitratireductor luteus]|uniref:hypothetical protein n=1 Tax=Nitratireductor luteus TaxID=2976980 RepID=UPI002240D9B0|nr:hypothetical protein [Nitratireductor luteus]